MCNIFKDHSDWVSAVAFLSDGKQIVSGSKDKTIWLWDSVIGAECDIFRDYSDWV